MAGITSAADNPCSTLATMSNTGSVATMTSNEPTILITKPTYVIFFLPSLSAIPPPTTINKPQNSEVKLVEIFKIPDDTLRSFCIVGMILIIDCANSQNVNIAKTMPKIYKSICLLAFMAIPL